MLTAYELFENTIAEAYPVAKSIDELSFESLVGSLPELEQELCDPDLIEDGDDVERFMVYTKIVMRYVDVAHGNTTMGDDGVLSVTPQSSLMELPLGSAAIVEAFSNQVFTIMDALMSIQDGVASAMFVKNMAEAVELIKEDYNVRLVI